MLADDVRGWGVRQREELDGDDEAKPCVESGALRRELSSWELPHIEAAVVWVAGRIEPPRVRAFIDWFPFNWKIRC